MAIDPALSRTPALSRRPTIAKELAQQGLHIATAAEQGPVVRLIGACCRAIAASWGETWPDIEVTLEPIERDLPSAGERIQRVRNYVKNPSKPLELLRSVLPFNFR